MDKEMMQQPDLPLRRVVRWSVNGLKLASLLGSSSTAESLAACKVYSSSISMWRRVISEVPDGLAKALLSLHHCDFFLCLVLFPPLFFHRSKIQSTSWISHSVSTSVENPACDKWKPSKDFKRRIQMECFCFGSWEVQIKTVAQGR